MKTIKVEKHDQAISSTFWREDKRVLNNRLFHRYTTLYELLLNLQKRI